MMKLVVMGMLGLMALGSSIGYSAEQTCFGVEEIPAISGEYEDNFDGYQLVDEAVWVSGGQGDELIFNHCDINNDEQYLISQNDLINLYSAGLYSRFEWTLVGDKTFYCQNVFNAESQEDASNFEKYPKADPADPVNGGCGMFGLAWTEITLM